LIQKVRPFGDGYTELVSWRWKHRARAVGFGYTEQCSWRWIHRARAVVGGYTKLGNLEMDTYS
jgi:hypothetical protein